MSKAKKTKKPLRKWAGATCSDGHSLDYEGQPCSYCSAALLKEKCRHGVCIRIEACSACERVVCLTAEEASEAIDALVALRQLLQLLVSPLLGLSQFPSDSPAGMVVEQSNTAVDKVRDAMRRAAARGSR